MVAHPYQNQNFPVNHIGIAVSSVDEVAEWYGKVFGFRRICNDATIDEKDDPKREGPLFKIYGSTLRKCKIAWLSTGNSVGIELFEFIDPPTEKQDFDYKRGGFFHICLTVPDPEAVLKKAIEHGGNQIGDGPAVMFDGEKGLYIQDPWGNAVEVLSCSFEQLMANRF